MSTEMAGPCALGRSPQTAVRVLVLLGVVLVAGPAGRASDKPGPARPPRELHARTWFNLSPVRLETQPDVLLYFFCPEDAELRRDVNVLNRVAARRDVHVVALTEADGAAVEKLIERHRIRFCVGAGSRSAHGFGIERTPTVLLVRRSDCKPVMEAVDTKVLPGLVPSWLRDGAMAAEVSDPLDLMQFISGPGDSIERRAAVKRLYEQVGAEDFIEYASAEAAAEINPDVRNHLEFWARAAAGEDVQGQMLAPSMAVERQFDGPDRAAFPAAANFDRSRLRSAESLEKQYAAHFADDPEDLLLRKWCVDALFALEDKAARREICMRLLPAETDFGLRALLTSALVQSCEVGDEEAAELLEELAKRESNIFHVRPWMENSVIFLRTGQQNVSKDAE